MLYYYNGEYHSLILFSVLSVSFSTLLVFSMAEPLSPTKLHMCVLSAHREGDTDVLRSISSLFCSRT